MPKEDTIKMDGVVEELLRNTQFRVTLETGTAIIATLSGKMKTRNIRVNVGDTVTCELSPYDLTKGRIVYRK